MAFLNKKEDVIDFQLTQYGKYLVSQGRFEPVYYAFFDDDIIYDQRYASGSDLETQKDIEVRIFDNTPCLESQYLFHSVDNLGMQDQFSRSKDAAERAKWDWHQAHRNKLQQTPEKHYALSNPLADSELSNDKAPAFAVNFNKGEIKNVEVAISGSDDEVFSIQQVPQINLKNVKFYISAKEARRARDGMFEDGTFLHVEANSISFRVTEENTLLDKDNFDVEVYVVDDKNKIKYPLYFQKEPEQLQDGILLDPVRGDVSPRSTLKTDDVEYFFDLFLDNDVPLRRQPRRGASKGGE